MDPDYSVKAGYPTLELSVVFLPKATKKIIIYKAGIIIASCHYLWMSHTYTNILL